MTKIFLIRHGMNDFIGKRIAGRKPGVHLNAEGLAQAQRLAERLSNERIQKIFSSPLERCQETAAPFAAQAGLKVDVLPSVAEIDYGDWTGQTLEELHQHPLWERWNSFRTGTRVPGGETMLEIQSRMVAEVQRLHATYAGQTVAVFSHGDPIKTVILFALGMPLDFFQRLEISPASVSLICFGDGFIQVGYVNDQAANRIAE